MKYVPYYKLSAGNITEITSYKSLTVDKIYYTKYTKRIKMPNKLWQNIQILKDIFYTVNMNYFWSLFSTVLDMATRKHF